MNELMEVNPYQAVVEIRPYQSQWQNGDMVERNISRKGRLKFSPREVIEDIGRRANPWVRPVFVGSVGATICLALASFGALINGIEGGTPSGVLIAVSTIGGGIFSGILARDSAS